jgi:hypothetical protein
MFHSRRQVALALRNTLAKEQGVTALYTQEMPVDFRHSAFCINFMQITGGCDLPFTPLQFYCHNNQPGTKIERP